MFMSDGYSGDRIFEERPWGHFKVVLDEPNIKIKKIVVKPKQRLSLQLHTGRYEWWKVISGSGEVQKGNTTVEVGMFDTVNIDKYEVHRIENIGDEDLVFVEIQTGVCQEGDIVRISDDYGRIE